MFGTVKKWDKKSSINGVEAQLVLDSAPEFKRDDVFLVYNETDTAVVCVESVETWKNILKMPTATTGEIIVAYREKRIEEEQNVAEIEAENIRLKNKLIEISETFDYLLTNVIPELGGNQNG